MRLQNFAFKNNYIFYEKDKELIYKILMYFTGNDYKLDLTKGLYIFGNFGVGKSYLMKFINAFLKLYNYDNSFRIMSIEQFIENYSSTGSFKKFINNTNDGNYLDIMIDELGVENEYQLKFYGNDLKDVFDSFLMRRYELFQRQKQLTHVTTNLEPGKLKEYYGKRLNDRFVEMFNFVEFKGESKRK